MFNWLIEVITFPRILAFILGMIFCQLIGWYVDRRRVKKGLPAKSSGANAVIGTVIILTMVWIMVSTQQARNCAINLNVAVAAEQDAATLERNGFQQAITESLSLPPDIQALPTNDPRRKALTDPITAEYMKKVNAANKIREASQDDQEAARKACGK